MLTATAAAAGAALAGASGLITPARAAATRDAATRDAAAPLAGTARVGATVVPAAYAKGTTWDQAMANFNHDVGRDFEVAKRYYMGPKSWPVKHKLGAQIQSLIDRGCRGLLCFKPAVDGSDLNALVASLNAIKAAKLTDVKVTLYQEQGLKDKLTATEFKQVYDNYGEAVNSIFPLFVDFSGSHPETWMDYRPAGVKGIAVDFYADVWAREKAKNNLDPLGVLAQWADEAGQELGIWEIGTSASSTVPTENQMKGYFGYLTSLQQRRLAAGNLVGDMAWFNGPHGGDSNTISGIKLSPRYKIDRTLLDGLFDTFNGSA